MTKNTSRSSVGSELVRRLRKFSSELSTTENLEQRFTCRTVKLVLQPSHYTPEMVKEVRGLLRASQPIFAQFLGVSPSCVKDWEQGNKPVSRTACRLMDEIRRQPEYFLARLKELATPAGD